MPDLPEPPLEAAAKPLPPGGLWALWNDPAFRMASFLTESFSMVGQLPSRVADLDDQIVANACLESFFVHVRLLAEFLIRRPPAKDFSALDFLWPVPTTPEAKRLADQWWNVASKHVVHFSRTRVPDDIADVEVVQDVVGFMTEAARDAFAVAADFVAALERNAHDQAPMLRRSLTRNGEYLHEMATRDRPLVAAVQMAIPEFKPPVFGVPNPPEDAG
jgi:hypothetical protein